MKKAKHKKKLKLKKFIFLFIFIFLAILIYLKCTNSAIDTNSNSISNLVEPSQQFKTIKQDTNSNYKGIGQKKVTNKDGYFTTFTTITQNKKIYKEYKQNGNSSWSQNYYWGGSMSDNGCGITAISIILSGYNKNYTPEKLRQMYLPKLDGNKISQVLTGFGIENSDFFYDTTHLSNEYIKNHLITNRPILICVWNKPTDNRWTTSSHYMVLLASDNANMVYVSNPNGLENNSKSSGWYNINEITPYIAKALFIKTY